MYDNIKETLLCSLSPVKHFVLRIQYLTQSYRGIWHKYSPHHIHAGRPQDVFLNTRIGSSCIENDVCKNGSRVLKLGWRTYTGFVHDHEENLSSSTYTICDRRRAHPQGNVKDRFFGLKQKEFTALYFSSPAGEKRQKKCRLSPSSDPQRWDKTFEESVYEALMGGLACNIAISHEASNTNA